MVGDINTDCAKYNEKNAKPEVNQNPVAAKFTAACIQEPKWASEMEKNNRVAGKDHI